MDAVIYTRISKDRTGAGLGVDRQEQDCRALAERLGWTVVAVYSDNDISAYSGKPRPGYKAMCGALEASRGTGVIAWHTDRLHRRNAELEPFIDLCTRRGVTVQTVTAGNVDLSTVSGQMTARILGAVAQQEIDHARERMKRAKEQAASSGVYRGGRRPFGYEADGMTVRQDEADALDAAARAILSGLSLRSVAKDFPLPTTGGREMDPVALRRILVRPRNAGLMEVAGQITGKAAWPAILEESVWRGVVALMSDPTRRTNAGPQRRWLGSGLLLCGECGSRLRVHRSPRRKQAYTCPDGKHVARDLEAVDAYVLSALCDRLAAPDMADLLAPEAVDLEPVRVEAASLRAQLDEVAALVGSGAFTPSQAAVASQGLRARLEAAEAALTQQHGGSALAALMGAPEPQAALMAAPVEVQRQVLDLLAEVTIFIGRRGRPRGWKPGQPYADLETVKIRWRGAAESAAPGAAGA